MHILWQTAIAVAAMSLLAWMVLSGPSRSSASTSQELLDPDNAQQMGALMGMMGGTIVDAALLRFVLQRFENEQGRRATTRDIATIAAMIRAQ